MMLISLYTSRVILDSLGVEDYGIYNAVGGFVSMFSVFRAGLVSATQRFITYDLGKGDLNELNHTFSTCVLIYLMLSVLIVFIGELLGGWFIENKMTIPELRLDAAKIVYHLSLLLLVIGLISNPYHALVIAHEKMSVFAYITIYEALEIDVDPTWEVIEFKFMQEFSEEDTVIAVFNNGEEITALFLEYEDGVFPIDFTFIANGLNQMYIISDYEPSY